MRHEKILFKKGKRCRGGGGGKTIKRKAKNQERNRNIKTTDYGNPERGIPLRSTKKLVCKA